MVASPASVWGIGEEEENHCVQADLLFAVKPVNMRAVLEFSSLSSRPWMLPGNGMIPHAAARARLSARLLRNR